MKPAYAVSFLAALCCHALLFFGIRIGSDAQPLALSNEPSTLDVNLVEPTPEPQPLPAPLATPAPTPEPVEPQSTPPMPPQPPDPTPAPFEEPTAAPSTPAPQPRETPLPRITQPAPPSQSPRPARTPSTQVAHPNIPNAPTGTRASYRINPKPDYPFDARRLHQEGLVLLSVEVGTDGRPTSVSLKRSSGFPLLDQAALEAVRRWTFEPARVGPLPVSSRVDVPVRFNLSN